MSRLALIALIGGAAAACSETGRLAGNPFSNPFGSSDPTETASADTAPSVKPVPRSAVSSAPLAAPGRVASAPLPTPSAVHPGTGALAAASGNPAFRAGPTDVAGWSSKGGSPVVVGQGDSLSTLSNRYGAPPQAILSANGLSSAAQVKPGTRLTIPVYAPGTRSAAVEKPPVPVEHSAPKLAFVEGKKPVEARAAAQLTEAKTAHPRPGRTLAAASEPQAARKVVASATPAKPEAKVAEVKPAAPAKPAHAQVAAAKTTEPVKVAEAKKPAEPKIAEIKKPADISKLADARKQPEPAKVAEIKKPAEQKVAALTPAEAPKGREVDTTASLPKTVTATASPAATAAAPAAPAVASADFRWPAHGRVISGFGGSGSNEGINIAVPDGTPVKAADGGTVAYAGNEVKGYGNLVLIRHANGYVSAYAHNGEIDVKRGQTVTRGQVIAKSGQTGNVTSPQIHFELRKGATPVDPMPHLASN